MGESFRDVHDTYTKTFGKRTRISSVFGQQTFLVVKEMPRKREPSFRKRLASYFRVMDVKEGEVLKTPEEPEQIIAKLSPKTEQFYEKLFWKKCMDYINTLHIYQSTMRFGRQHKNMDVTYVCEMPVGTMERTIMSTVEGERKTECMFTMRNGTISIAVCITMMLYTFAYDVSDYGNIYGVGEDGNILIDVAPIKHMRNLEMKTLENLETF